MLFAAVDWHSLFFMLFALIACSFAAGVLFSSNIVRMAFYLIISLGAVAGLFILAGAQFLGAMQIMIYVGGTLVLLIFGVMLTAQGPFISMKTRGGEWILAAIVGGSLFAVLVPTAFRFEAFRGMKLEQAESIEARPTAAPLGLGLLGVRVDRLEQSNPQLRDGMSGYLLPFEIVSVYLLVVLIAAAHLARAKRRAAPGAKS